MRKLNMSVAKNYVDKNTGANKTKWINIGSLVIQDDGKVFGEIEAIPFGVTEFRFNCFDKDENQLPQQNQPQYQQQEYGNNQQMQQPQRQQPTYEYQDANGRAVTKQHWEQNQRR